MKNIYRRLRSVALLSALLLVLAGCGDQDDVSTAANDAQQADQQSNDNDDDEECDDGYFLHPIQEECVAEGDNDDSDDCDDDEEFDDEAGECVDRCPVDEFWDDEEEECVDIGDPGDCSDFEEWDEDTEQCVPTGECGPGSIVGESCRPDLGVLPGATVEIKGVDCDGMEYSDETTADDQGIYEFDDVPSGTHDLTITSGSWSETDEVDVNAGTETDLTDETAKICVGSTSVNIAVIEGGWDDIPSLLDGMDVDYDMINDSDLDAESVNNFLGDLDEMKEYDIIFVECGPPGRDEDLHDDNIRHYIQDGNSLYGSDLAYDFLEEPLPDAITTEGGGPTGTYTVDVASSEMMTLLDQDTVEIHYNTVFRSIVSVGSTGTIHFEGDVGMGSDDTPVMMSYDDPIGGGRAIFTTFHNSEQPTGDMEEILEFMIFQL